ncbi:hypothetical protein [Verrucomicrobium spinosum]|uniref:putative polyvalent protein kinase domain-containing protein n=1 Tax=Verrucomicrobium spinosum TaxID=2736 RepID=UPI0018DD7026|nr:hypothetical protein [Verrucomicrobium spinosum]
MHILTLKNSYAIIVNHGIRFISSTSAGCENPDACGDASRTLQELLVRAQAHESAANAPNDADKWERSQSESLVHWAQEKGLILDHGQFESRIADLKRLEGGYEHRVFSWAEAGRVIKVTKPPHFGLNWDLSIYVQNVINCNLLFGDDMRIEGIIETPDGAALVMSQEFIPGKSPTYQQIAKWFGGQGYTQHSQHLWIHPDGRKVNDAHPRNFIVDRNHQMFPIDLHVESLGTWISQEGET